MAMRRDLPGIIFVPLILLWEGISLNQNEVNYIMEKIICQKCIQAKD